MKKIYIITITLVLIFSGCTKFLTIEPIDDLIREEFWKTEGDVVAVIGSTYASMNEILDDIYYWSELRGGLISPDPKRAKDATREFYNFNINEYNDKIPWNDFYGIINLANTIIEYTSLAKENDRTFTDVAYNGYIAEAYYIRSLCYFYLVKAFKEVPFITKSYSTDEQDFNIEKSSEKVIIDQLIVDLNSIVDKAFTKDFFTNVDQQKGRVTKNAVYALLADIYLWNNDYQNCIKSCDNIKETYLVSGDSYFSIYSGKGNSLESIFELQFDFIEYRTTNGFVKDKNLYIITSNNTDGQKEDIVSELLITLYALNDLRQYSSKGNVTYHPTLLSLWKYEGQAPYDKEAKSVVNRTKSRSDANWIFYRLADIHLMKAEAYTEMDDFTNALAQLNIIRSRAGIDEFSTTNKKSLLSEILDERARELVGEGKRWFDLVRVCRRDVGSRLSIISTAVMSNVDPSSRSAVENKLNDTDSWFLPISNSELTFNKKLKQNSFYE